MCVPIECATLIPCDCVRVLSGVSGTAITICEMEIAFTWVLQVTMNSELASRELAV